VGYRTCEAVTRNRNDRGAQAHYRVHWDKELGAISEIMQKEWSALLFDKIQGYPAGYRVLSNAFQSLARTASALGVPKELSKVEMVNAFRKRLKNIKPISPVEVKNGPIMQMS